MNLVDFTKMINHVKFIEIPEKIDIDEIQDRYDKLLEQARKFDAYERDKEEYDKWVKEGKEAAEAAKKADDKVKKIEKERADLIAAAKMPEGFEMNEDGLLYNGYPLSENQISQSAKYIAALKLGEMVLGEVRTLHFDASSLDNISLGEVQKWAESKDLQLLIERPDFEGGEIQYQIIEK